MFLAVRSITQTGTLRFCLVTLFSRCFLPNGLCRAIITPHQYLASSGCLSSAKGRTLCALSSKSDCPVGEIIFPSVTVPAVLKESVINPAAANCCKAVRATFLEPETARLGFTHRFFGPPNCCDM